MHRYTSSLNLPPLRPQSAASDRQLPALKDVFSDLYTLPEFAAPSRSSRSRANSFIEPIVTKKACALCKKRHTSCGSERPCRVSNLSLKAQYAYSERTDMYGCWSRVRRSPFDSSPRSGRLVPCLSICRPRPKDIRARAGRM